MSTLDKVLYDVGLQACFNLLDNAQKYSISALSKKNCFLTT